MGTNASTTTRAPAATPAASSPQPSDTPSAYAISADWWVPTIEHSGRVSYLRTERFRRKAKPSAALATAYASRVLAWRQHFEAYRRIRREAIETPRWTVTQAGVDYLEAAE
jgi:hypothetical protein